MIDPRQFRDAELRGGFTLVDLEFTTEPLLDAIGRRAIAKTVIVGRELRIEIFAGLSESEQSVSVYHEVLEALTVGTAAPPSSVMEFNESDFERVGYDAHKRLGVVSPDNLNRMLQMYGFVEE